MQPLQTPPFSTRLAGLDDVAPLVDLVNSAYRGDSSRAGWTTEADLLGGQRTDTEGLATLIGRSDAALLVCCEPDGRLVACVALEQRPAACYLGMLTVQPTLQARGLGRQVLVAAETFARDRWQRARIIMTVIAQRPELIGWYERRGYRRTGRQERFPYGDERFGLPTRPDLIFEVLEKVLT